MSPLYFLKTPERKRKFRVELETAVRATHLVEIVDVVVWDLNDLGMITHVFLSLDGFDRYYLDSHRDSLPAWESVETCGNMWKGNYDTHARRVKNSQGQLVKKEEEKKGNVEKKYQRGDELRKAEVYIESSWFKVSQHANLKARTSGYNKGSILLLCFAFQSHATGV